MGLDRAGLEVMGRLSAIVLPKIGPESVARRAYKHCLERGLIVNNIEFPACRRGEARFRLQLTPQHSEGDVDRAVAIMVDAIAAARQDAHDSAGGSGSRRSSRQAGSTPRHPSPQEVVTPDGTERVEHLTA